MKSLITHLHEIRAEGYPALKRKTAIGFSYLVLCFHGFWALPAALFIRCLRPWRIIRLGPIQSDRIGHFVMDATLSWLGSQSENNKYLDYYWINDRRISNTFWAKMVRRNLPCPPGVRILDTYSKYLPGVSYHHRPSTTTKSRDIYGLVEKMQKQMAFLPEEDVQAKDFLRSIGWQEGEPFVCLQVRDEAYMNNDLLHSKCELKEENSHKHDHFQGHGFRNSDIASYVPATEWLADQGYWIMRMGKIMSKPIPTNYPRIVDYAFHPQKSDFLDVWLFAHCKMCISTSTGPDRISGCYRRPILLLGFLPISRFISYEHAVHVPKKLEWVNKRRFLTLKEQIPITVLKLKNNFFQDGSLCLEHEGDIIRINPLSPEEILASVQEMHLRLEGLWVDNEDDLKYQEYFCKTLKELPDYDQVHNWMHPEARVATTWLRQMARNQAI